MKETEPIFDDLRKFGLGFQSMNPNDHRLWPIGRGLYINCARTQSILINEDEHLRFVCAELNDDFGLYFHPYINFIVGLVILHIILWIFQDPCIAT